MAADTTPKSSSPSPEDLSALDEDKRFQRLKFLVERSKIYASILTERLASRSATPRESSPDTSKNINNVEPSSENEKEKGKKDEEEIVPRRSSRLDKGRSQPTPVTRKRRTRAKSEKKVQKSILDSFGSSEIEQVTSTVPMNEAIKAESDNGLAGTTEPATMAQPRLITGGTLHSYQLAGVEWLVSLYENGLNGILADEMGLGKTLQTIAFLAYLIENNVPGPFLIVAPLSTIQNWIKEIHRFAPSIGAIKYHGDQAKRAEIRSKQMTAKKLKENPIVVTSYEMVVRDCPFLLKYSWNYVIVDEGHRLKNMNCLLIKQLKRLDSANRLLLTGTPLQNNLAELWSLLNFLLPDIFTDLELFQKWFDDIGGIDAFDEDKSKALIASLHSILRPFLLRRLKCDVERNLPEKREYVIYGPLTTDQRELYEHILHKTAREYIIGKIIESRGGKRPRSITPKLTNGELPAKRRRRRTRYSDDADDDDQYSDDDFIKRISDEATAEMAQGSEREEETNAMIKIAAREVSAKSLQNLVMQLRLTCNTPHLFYYPWTENDRVDRRIVDVSSKMIFLDKLTTELVKTGHRMLVFSQFTRMLNILQDWALEVKNWRICRIDGSTAQDDRQDQIDEFNENPEIKMFLLSTRSGGLGINLTAADTVILFDSDWNPQQDLQAIDRVHRIGQTKPVIVYRLATANTVEQNLIERANSKRRLGQVVIERGRFKGFGYEATSEEEVLSEMEKEFKRESAHTDLSGMTRGAWVTDKDFKTLLDRSPAAYERARKGEENLSGNIATTTTAAGF
ncbi:uncharacterized ATP-dependent helicase Irc5p [Trichomonascus vanleenenianus]|uniref:putative ATPase n=1 Tax=Trichomonascus vanleenenianus TaxID=2268995 RepID=UPI003ECA7ED0